VALHVRSGDLLGRTSRDQFGRTSLVDAPRHAISLGEPATITLAEPTAISLAEPRAISYAGPSHYSLIATCEANGVNPVAYLADVLLRVQSHPASRVDELLPHRWKPTAPQ
jgi:hypothetical protein